MKYLESAIKFSIKNWMLILPLFVLTALASLLGGVGRSSMDYGKLFSTFGSMNNFSSPGNMMSTLPGLFSSMAVGGGILAILVQFVSIPATYGLVNKSLDTGNASLNDIGAAVTGNFIKYVMYFIGMVVLGLAIGIGSSILMLILGLLTSLINILGVLLVIVGLALFIACIILAVLLSMWLSAMIVDGLDVVAAAKKSIEIVKGCFWTVLGITILVFIAVTIAGFILGLLSRIPLLGPIIYSAVPTAQTFIMIVFLLTLYRERTGKVNTL